jgi:hypothetical protein
MTQHLNQGDLFRESLLREASSNESILRRGPAKIVFPQPVRRGELAEF